MKKNRGNLILLLLLLLSVPLMALDGFSYDLNISNKTPYLKEAVIVTMEVKQTGEDGVIMFEFHPKKSSAYKLLFLGEEDLKEANDFTHIKFKYALFPLKIGKIDLDFLFIVKKASTEELKEVAIGARNVLRVVKTVDTPIGLENITLDVQKLPEGVQLVGRYSLEYTLGSDEVAPFSQLNLSYTLKGYGYPPQVDTILPDIEGVDAFMEVEKFDNKLFHKHIYHYALLTQKSFLIPDVSLKAFDPKKRKTYILKVPAKKVRVIPINPDEIIDEKNSLPLQFDFLEYKRYLYYLLFFVAGFLCAKLLPQLQKRFSQKLDQKSFTQKIESIDDPKVLLKYLLIYNPHLFSSEIETLEGVMYHDKKISFKSLKEQILKKAGDGS